MTCSPFVRKGGNVPSSFTKRWAPSRNWRVARRDRPSAARRASYKIDAILEELKELASRLGLQVREERLLREVGYRVNSGICRVRDSHILFVDRDLPPASRLEVLLDELSRRDLRDVYVSPELRRILGKDDRFNSETAG